MATPAPGRPGFPLGASLTLSSMDGDPHPVLARLRQREPVSWVPALGGWLVTRRDLATGVLRDSAGFTVDDPRFTTARVIGPSMLSVDGREHTRHRAPFAARFTRAAVTDGLEAFVESQAERLVAGLRPAGAGDLRRGLAGPLAAVVTARVLGLPDIAPATVLSWYDAIVAAVSALPPGAPDGRGPAAGPATAALPGAGAAGGAGVSAAAGEPGAAERGELIAAGMEAASRFGAHLRAGPGRGPGGLPGETRLSATETVSNAAVIAFGGIETTEGMIANALLHLLSDPAQLRQVRADPSLVPDAVEESLRLEPAAALVDRYATRGIRIAGADIRRGDLVRVSLAAVGRDPAVFRDPDRFDIGRGGTRAHLAFARGPHFCIGAHLARLEARCAVRAALRLPGLRLDPARPATVRGIVFRKPPSLHARWDRDGPGPVPGAPDGVAP